MTRVVFYEVQQRQATGRRLVCEKLEAIDCQVERIVSFRFHSTDLLHPVSRLLGLLHQVLR